MKGSTVLLLVASIFAVISFYATFYGFFVAGGVRFSDASQTNLLEKDQSQWFPRKGKVLMILFDSLRFDYLMENGDIAGNKQFPQNKFRQFEQAYQQNPDKFVLMRARADAPTMTVNRIPCIATGNIPPKSALLQSLGASAAVEDSFPKQMRLQRYKSYYAGDPLWPQVFPNEFTEAHPAPGYNLKDNTVDKIPLAFLKTKLKENDFDFLFVHLIAMDHMAHAYGLSDLRVAEQIKINDQLIIDLMNTIDDDTTLLIIGDHGSQFSGVHGGGTEDEINTAIVAYHKKGFQKYQQKDLSQIMRSINETTLSVKQQDIAPTISMLLGLPIPFSNMGQIISDVYPAVGYSYEEKKCKGAAFEAQMLHDNYLNTLQILNYLEKVQLQTHLFEKVNIDEIESLAAEIKTHYNKIIEMVKSSQQCEPAFHENTVAGTLKAQQFSEKVYKLVRGAGTYDVPLIEESYVLLVLVLVSYVFIIQYLYKFGHSEKKISLNPKGLVKHAQKISLGLIGLAVVGILASFYHGGKPVQAFTTTMICSAVWFCGFIVLSLLNDQQHLAKIPDDPEASEGTPIPFEAVKNTSEKSYVETSYNEKIEMESQVRQRDDQQLVRHAATQPVLIKNTLFLLQAPLISLAAVLTIVICVICVHLGKFKRASYDIIDPAAPFLVLLALAYRNFRRFPGELKKIALSATIVGVLLFLSNAQDITSERVRICVGLALILDFVLSDISSLVYKYGVGKAWGAAFLACFALLTAYHIIDNGDNYWVQIILPRSFWAVLSGIIVATFVVFKNSSETKKKLLQLCLFLYLVLLQDSGEVISFAIVGIMMKICNQVSRSARPLNYIYPLAIAVLCQFGLHILKHNDVSLPTNFDAGFIGLNDINWVLSPLNILLNLITSYVLGLLALSNYKNSQGESKMPQEHLQVIKKRNIILYIFMFSIIYFGAAVKCYLWRYFFLGDAQEKLIMDFAIYLVISIASLSIF